ncbi:MAG: hypothetical protein RPT25_12225 [Cycloclasticus sp.]
MGIKIQYPAAGEFQHFLLLVSIGVGLLAMLDIVDYIMRDEESFYNRKEYCGVISDYYHDRDRKGSKGHATWRLVVENQDSRKMYAVGFGYIQNNIEFDQFRVGAKICVEVIPTITEFDYAFVSQIEISGINFLDSEGVRKQFFELKAHIFWFLGFSCALGFCVLIKYKKEC